MSEFTEKMIRKAASGDQDAIAELYELTYSSVYKTVKSMIADEDAVLDILQDSFIKGFQSLDQLDAPENFRAWMKRIATNKAKDYLKRRKPVLFSEMVTEDGEEIDFPDACLDHCPEEVIDRQETVRLMQEILSTLSEDQRLVIGMFYYEEMSIREIAQILGCSENTVKSRLNYGRKKVEVKVKELEKRGTKLYSLAPLPFLLWLFRMDAKTREIPSSAVLEAVTAKCAVPGTAAVSGVATASVSVKAVAGAGIKTLAAKIVAGVLAVSMIGGGAVLMFSSQDSREVVPTEQTDISNGTIVFAEEAAAETLEAPTASAEPVADAALDAYEQVITDFVAACATDSERWLSNAEIYRQQYSNLNTERLDNYHRYAGMAFYYAFVDLDENGIYELVIGEQNQIEPRHVIISIYSFDGSGAVEIIECGNNHIADICTDGRVILTEGTILDGTSYICAMSDDGIYPQIIAEHTYDLYAGTYTNGSETISSQEYYARYASGGYWTIEWNYLCG